jgi:hypothetical protein
MSDISDEKETHLCFVHGSLFLTGFLVQDTSPGRGGDVDACSNGSWSMMSGKSNERHAEGRVSDVGMQTSASCLQGESVRSSSSRSYSRPVEFVDPLLGETSSSESSHSLVRKRERLSL